MSDDAGYRDYLKSRSKLGLIYRRFWLYPAVDRYLSGKTLDVGCGIGDFLKFRPNTFGVDVNPTLVDWCRAQGLDAELVMDDHMSFNDKSFESVIMDNVLEHVVDPHDLLSEVHRVLMTSGNLIVGVPGKKGFLHDPDHKVFYNACQLKDAICRAGFEMMKVIHMPFKCKYFDKFLRQYCIYGIFRRV